MRSHYLHGTHREEQARLHLLNEQINPSCLRELSLGEERRVLDVGSGMGQFSVEMAKALRPGSRVLGIERDPAQLGHARTQSAPVGVSLEFREGSAEALPLDPGEWGSFDLAHSRYLLEHVPHPERVVQELARAVRPGGRVVLADDDHDVMRLWPEPPGFRRLWEAYVECYRRNHNDPYVGRRLVELLHRSGLAPSRNTWVFFGCCAGHADFTGLARNLAGVIEGVRSDILSHAMLTSAEFSKAMEELEAWANRPDAALWYSICWAEAMRPA